MRRRVSDVRTMKTATNARADEGGQQRRSRAASQSKCAIDEESPSGNGATFFIERRVAE
jgi:hypothetical protein